MTRDATSAPQRSEERKAQKGATDHPLRTNRGEHDLSDYVTLTLADGEVKQVLKRSGSNNAVFLDWLSFSVNITGWLKIDGDKCFTDDDIARAMSAKLEEIFGQGFGISKKNPHGMNFHRDSYVIGESWGLFCIGHRNNRFLVTISGDGWLNASPDSAVKLHEYLTLLNKNGADVRLSRVDLAADYYEGVCTHEEFAEAYHRGDFVRQRQHLQNKDAWSSYQIIGCIHTNRGREAGITHAIGVRTSDLYLRCYDKGRQLGDKSSSWQRVELEIKSKDTLISLDVLINPEQFFCQYQWLKNLRNSDANRFETKVKRAEITVQASMEVIKTQFGKYLRVLRGLYDTDKELLDLLESDSTDYPKRLAKIAPQGFTPLHRQEVRNFTPFQDLTDLASSVFGCAEGQGFSFSH